VADAALLWQKNIEALGAKGYAYILGGRLNNEAEVIKAQVVEIRVQQGKPKEVRTENDRLIVN
jgi:hypothetical protein